ncbi:MAG: LemA family protein [Bacteroidales bacterium]|jgi:LemA protein|nr:LemA family protein [Bacteroidales bacterium]
MSKKTISIIIVIGVISLVVFWSVSKYNNLIRKDETCNKQWAVVESQYQRRLDLIPNLVNVVKGYAKHEQETFTEVIKARNQAAHVKINPNNVTQENINELQTTQDNLTSALQKFNLVVERYPELKANENFIELQSQLEGTENRIAVERQRFSEVVGDFNASIRRFPTNIVANLFGFERKVYFEAQKGAENAPKVEF